MPRKGGRKRTGRVEGAGQSNRNNLEGRGDGPGSSMRGPPGAGGGGGAAPPYSYNHSGSYRERRRARRQALAAATSASASSSAAAGGVPLAAGGPGGPQLGVGVGGVVLPWSASTRSSVANCSSSEDGVGIGVGAAAAAGGEFQYYYQPQPNRSAQQHYQHLQQQQYHHRAGAERRRWGAGGGAGGGGGAHMMTNYEECNNNTNNHNNSSVRMALAMGLGFGPRYGDAQSADVVLKLKSSVPCGGVGVGAAVEACGSAGEGCASGDDGSATAGVEGGVGSGEGEEMVVVEPLYLHSKALRRSEFFDARLSERWRCGVENGCSSSGGGGGGGGGKGGEGSSRPGLVELMLDSCRDPQTYVRCVQLLYVPARVMHTCFASVEDALNILEVAAELLFHDCVTACMRYLESVPWTHENESAIRACVSNLHLQPSDDLAARLCSPESVPDVKPVDIMHGVLGELLTLVTAGAPSKARDITERVLLANVQPASSPAFATVNEVALFREFSGNLETLKVQLRKFANFLSWNGHPVNVACSALRWLLDELFTLQIADEAVRMFSEEKELAQLMVQRTYQNPFTDTLFVILVRMLQALQRGDVLSPRSVRLALLTTWLPVIAKLGNDDDNFALDESHRSMEEGLGAVVETLPMVDQEMIFRIWIGACLKCRRAWPDLSDAFESWCSKLRQAHREADVERSGGGSCSENVCLTTS